MKKVCLIISIIWLVSSFVTPCIFAEELLNESSKEVLITETEKISFLENEIDENVKEEIIYEKITGDDLKDEIVAMADEETEIETAAVTETSIIYDGTTNANERTTFAKYNGSATDVSGLDFYVNKEGPQNAADDVVYYVSGTSTVDDYNIYKYCFSKDLSKESNFVGVNAYSYSIDVYFPTLTDDNARSEIVVAAGVNKSAPTAAFVVGAFDTKRTYNNSTIVIDGLENDKWYNIAFDISYNGSKNGENAGSRLERNIYINGKLVNKYYKWDNSNKKWKENTTVPIASTSTSSYDTWNMLARPSLKFVNGEKHNFYFDNVIYKNTAYTPANIPTIESAVDGVVTVDEGKSATDIAALTTNANKTEVYRYNSTTKTYAIVADAVATGDIVKLVSLGGAYNYYQVSVNATTPVPPTPSVPSSPIPTVESSVLVKDFDFELNTYDENIKISAPSYKKGDVVLEGNISANDVVNVTLAGTNSGSEKDLYLVSALYDDKNTMLCAEYDSVKMSGDFQLSVSIKSPENLAKGNYSIKTFLWDNVDANYIYTDNFDISKNGGVNFASYGWNLTDYSFISSEDKYTGKNALKIVSGTDSDKVISQEVELEKNDVYKLAFASKGDEGFMYDVMDNDFSSLLAGGAKTFAGNAEWDLSSIVFESKDNEKVNLVFKQGVADAKAFIDNVVITKSLMLNGGFESGKTGFVFDLYNDVKDENALDGTNAGYIESGKITQNINLVSGYDYKLVFYSKGAKVTAKILDDANNKVIKKEFDASAVYRYNSVNFKAPAGKTEFSVEFLADGEAYIDCVSLEKKPLNLIENADVKYGIFDLWSVSNKGTSELEAVKDGDEYALKLSGRPYNYTRLETFVNEGVAENGNGKYKFTADIKFANEGETGAFEVYLMYKDSLGENKNDYKKFDNITDEWTAVDWEIDITNDKILTDKRGQISVATGNTADIMIKNVKFVKVSE